VIASDAGATEPGWRSLLGRKVSVRYKLHDDPDHPHSEAIGVVMAVREDDSGEFVSLLDRKGRITEIAAADVLARKIFPT
jgi:hypothetical protein